MGHMVCKDSKFGAHIQGAWYEVETPGVRHLQHTPVQARLGVVGPPSSPKKVAKVSVIHMLGALGKLKAR